METDRNTNSGQTENTPREINSDTRDSPQGEAGTDTHSENLKKTGGNDPEARSRRTRPETEEGPRGPQKPCADKDSENDRHPGSKADTKIQNKAKPLVETPQSASGPAGQPCTTPPRPHGHTPIWK